MDIASLQQQLRGFAQERGWEKFHSPKNLCMALAGEVGELTEHFQWLTEEESRKIEEGKLKTAVGEELADVFIYTLRLFDQLGIDIESTVTKKIAKNAEKYPAALQKGSITKRSDRG